MVHKSSALAAGTGGGTAGGTVSNITSSGGTITVTNPTGPTTNIDAVLATASTPGIVEPDNVTITINGSGVISSVAGGAGTVTSVSGVTANGFAFSITNPTVNPAITAKTTITGILQGNGTAISAVASGGIATSLLASNSLTVSGVSGVTGGGVVALGSAITLGMAGNTANTLAGYNSSGVFSDVSLGSNLSLSGGILNGTVGPAPVTSVFGRIGAVVANYADYAFNLISGVASVSQGGTGVQTLPAHGVLLGEGIGNISAATTGTAGRLLIDQGVADPAFEVMSGDAVIAATGAITLATVNTNTGSFGSSTSIPNFTVNGKGLITAAAGNAVIAPAGTLTGTTLASNVTASSLTTVGALASGSLVSGFTPLSNALLANSAITIGAQTGLSGGGSVALGSAITLSMNTSTANTLAGYNNSGVFADVAIGSNLSLIGGTLTATAGTGAISSVFGRTGIVVANWNDYQFNLIGGTASVSQGGTGQTTLPAHSVLLGEGAVTGIGAATTGIAGRILIDQGGVDPAFEVVTGDVSVVSTGAHTVLAVHGVTYPSSPSTNTVPVVTSSNTVTYEQVPNAALLNSAITVGAGTGLTGGGSVALGGSTTLSLTSNSVTVSGVSGVTGGGTVALGSSITIGMADSIANTLAGYNSSGVFSDVSIGSNLSLSGGILNGTVGSSPVSSVFGRTGAITANWNDYQFNLVGGTASASQGGTGLQTLTAHAVLLGEGVSAVSFATTGTAARILIDQGNADPAFKVLTGDSSLASTGAMVNTAVNSVAYPASPGTNTVPVVTGTNQVTYEAVPNAALANSAITIGAQTGLAGGGSVALGSAITLSMGTSVANTLAGYNSSGVFSDVSIGSNLSLSGGILTATAGGGAVSSVFSRTGAVTANWNDYQFNLIGGTASSSQGGTGNTTYTSGQILVGNSGGTLTPSAISAGANITITNGSGIIGISSSGGAGGVSSVSNTDGGSLTITPQTGSVTASLNVGHANTWTATQTSAVSGGISSLISTGCIEFGIFANGNSGTGNPSLKWANGNIQSVTISGACTLGFTLPANGGRLTVVSTQSSGTGFSYNYPGTVLWPGGIIPTLSSISGGIDIASFLYDNINVYGVANTGFLI